MPVIDIRVYMNFMARWTPAEQARLRELKAANELDECPFVDRVRGPAEGQGPFERAATELLAAWSSDDVERLVNERIRCSVPAGVEIEQGSEVCGSWFQISNRGKREWFAVAGEFDAR